MKDHQTDSYEYIEQM